MWSNILSAVYLSKMSQVLEETAGTTDYLTRQSRYQKKLNNRDTNYTNFHELLLGYEEKFKRRNCYAELIFDRITGLTGLFLLSILSILLSCQKQFNNK